MIPIFNISKIKQKINLHRLQYLSRRRSRYPKETSFMSKPRVFYYYLVLQSDLGGTYDGGEIYEDTVQYAIDFWFNYKPDILHASRPEGEYFVNNQNQDMAALKRKTPFNPSYYNYEVEYSTDDNDKEVEDLGMVLEISERLPTPYEEVIEEMSRTGSNESEARETANELQKIRFKTTGFPKYEPVENTHSYRYGPSGAKVRFIYLGTGDTYYEKLLQLNR